MNTKRFLIAGLLCVAMLGSLPAQADVQERLIYATDFQDWTSIGSSTTPTTVKKTTNFSKEEFDITFCETSVDPSGYQETRFCYTDGSGKGTGPFTTGYAMAAKSATPYIETGVLGNITKVSFVHGATGGSRGWKCLKKSSKDADWVVLSEAVANPATGIEVICAINEDSVALRFENLNASQNAYMSELKIYANVDITAKQVTLTTQVEPSAAGKITVSPVSPSYDEGSSIHLLVERNFGYIFSHWTNGDSIVSTEAAFDYIIQKDDTLTAVFDSIATYSFDCKIEGSRFGRYTIAPEPTNGRYEEGTTIEITPHSNEVMTFLNWENGTTDKKRSLTITQDTTISATWSEIDYIVGWDFFNSGNGNLAGQFYSETSNTGIFSAIKLSDNSTTSWLEKSGITLGEGKNCAIIWKSYSELGQYAYQATFGTENYHHIVLKYDMMNCGYSTYTTQFAQYSIDGSNFKNIDTISFPSTKSWQSSSFELPAECEGLAKLYIRWIADTNSAIMGTEGNDGTSISNVFVLAEKEYVADTIAPKMISSIPAANGVGASASGSIILTFDEKVLAGNDTVTLRGWFDGEESTQALTGDFGSSNVVFNYSGLTYGSTYTVTIPGNAVIDQSGNAYEGNVFSFTVMNKTQPSARLFNAIVAQDSTGDYVTLGEAIKAAPSNSGTPYLIFIKEGYYKEHLQIDQKNIHLIGQGADKVTITCDLLCGTTTDASVPAEKQGLHVSAGASVVVYGNDFYAEGISFENEWGITKKAGPQALALYTECDRALLYKCRLRSYQDTYLTSYSKSSNRHYLKDCLIEGAVDFIYGGGDVYFDHCDIYINRTSGGYITAPSHGADTKWGYIFMNNTIDAPVQTSVYFGRPWHNAPKVSFVNTTLGKNLSIYAAGWYQTMGAIPAIFADYNTMDVEGNPVDLSNRNDYYYYYSDDAKTQKVEGYAKKTLTDEEVAQYTLRNVLLGSDNWMPASIIEACQTPQPIRQGDSITWETVPYAICYVISVDGVVTQFTTETSIANLQGNVTVQAANEHGSLSEAGVVKASSIKTTEQMSIQIVGDNHQIHFYGIHTETMIEVLHLSGQLCKQAKINGDSDIAVPNGFYVVRLQTADGCKTQKVMVK